MKSNSSSLINRMCSLRYALCVAAGTCMLSIAFLSSSVVSRAQTSDLVPADSIPADSLPADSVSPDSVSDRYSKRSSGAKITPVDIDRDKPRQPVMHYYDKHGNPLKEPVMFLAELDTVKKVSPRSPYPLYNGVSIGVNFADAIMMAAGQKYASFDIAADVSLHNWFFPTVEAGVGFGKREGGEGRNYSYKALPSPYLKVGLNYNFLYKSNPDYQVFVGLRAGFSHLRYEVNDITVSSGYWDETQRFSISDLSATSIYGEALAGLKVKIWKAFSMGWTIRYHFKLHTSLSGNAVLSPAIEGMATPGGDPWFIPGYGANSPLTFTFSLIWTIPGKKKLISSENLVESK